MKSLLREEEELGNLRGEREDEDERRERLELEETRVMRDMEIAIIHSATS